MALIPISSSSNGLSSPLTMSEKILCPQFRKTNPSEYVVGFLERHYGQEITGDLRTFFFAYLKNPAGIDNGTIYFSADRSFYMKFKLSPEAFIDTDLLKKLHTPYCIYEKMIRLLVIKNMEEHIRKVTEIFTPILRLSDKLYEETCILAGYATKGDYEGYKRYSAGRTRRDPIGKDMVAGGNHDLLKHFAEKSPVCPIYTYKPVKAAGKTGDVKIIDMVLKRIHEFKRIEILPYLFYGLAKGRHYDLVSRYLTQLNLGIPYVKEYLFIGYVRTGDIEMMEKTPEVFCGNTCIKSLLKCGKPEVLECFLRLISERRVIIVDLNFNVNEEMIPKAT